MNKPTTALLLSFATASATAQAQNKNGMANTFSMNLCRTINVPLEKVWQAWSDSAIVKQWWGPEGFTAPVAKMNFKEDGVSLVCMRSPEGLEIYNSWMYTKILPMYSIEFAQRFTDKEGNKLNPADIGLPPGIPEIVPHIIRFEDLGSGTTKLTVTESGYTSEQTVEISKAGMQQCLDKMEKVLLMHKAQLSEKVVRKQIAINASAEKLWDVLTKPEMIKHWLGGTNAESDWKAGSPISFSGEWNGSAYKDKGVVLQFIPLQIFQFSFWSSFSGLPDKAENYAIVTLQVAQKSNATQLILTQRNVATAEMYKHSDKNWDESLAIIKKLSEN
ncbi:MAG TPA: SRPBCC family protein [Flavobacteriales bacterium]|nr:SRPBCC family protein [Flavobacteriales bacterium]